MKNPICKECGETYPVRRKELGYSTCLECGEVHAQKEIAFKRRCSAPAYNKGPYMYISSEQLAHDAGKK